jgi:protein phosphatase
MEVKRPAIPITEKDPPASWAASQTGPRQQNEDDYGRADHDTQGYNWVHRGCLYLLADGMGGLDDGKEAAQAAVRQVIQEYRNSNGRSQAVAENLTHAMQNANQHLYKAGTRSGKRMGSTMVACVLKDGKATIAHVGDSRAYQLANGEINRLTRDHLYATEVQGIKDDDEAKRSPEGHKITRALGKDPDLRVDINEVEYLAGDRFLLCSDGISEVLSKEMIGQCLGQKTPEKAVGAICSAVESRLNDNATVVVIFASGKKIRFQKTIRRAGKYAAAAVLFVAVAGGGYWGWKSWHPSSTVASAASTSSTVSASSSPAASNSSGTSTSNPPGGDSIASSATGGRSTDNTSSRLPKDNNDQSKSHQKPPKPPAGHTKESSPTKKVAEGSLTNRTVEPVKPEPVQPQPNSPGSTAISHGATPSSNDPVSLVTVHNLTEHPITFWVEGDEQQMKIVEAKGQYDMSQVWQTPPKRICWKQESGKSVKCAPVSGNKAEIKE